MRVEHELTYDGFKLAEISVEVNLFLCHKQSLEIRTENVFFPNLLNFPFCPCKLWVQLLDPFHSRKTQM